MRYQPLGGSGLLVSEVGLGCNNFGGRIDATATRAVVDAAIDAGVTLFDTADIYGNAGGSETLLGEMLQGRRDQVVLATKFGHQDHPMGYPAAIGARGSRSYVRYAVEQSLRRLRTDHIDLYQLHTPDPVTPMEETLAALHELVLEGKVRYVGHSNLAGWQIADAAHLAAAGGWTPFISAQNEYSLLEREIEREVVPAAEHYGLGVLPFFPLAKGLLTGKVTRDGGIPAGTRLAGTPAFRHRRQAGPRRGAARLGRQARPHVARGRDRRARRAARCGVGDRRRDERRAGARERRGRRLAPDRRGARRDRRDRSGPAGRLTDRLSDRSG